MSEVKQKVKEFNQDRREEKEEVARKWNNMREKGAGGIDWRRNPHSVLLLYNYIIIVLL